MIQQAIEFLQLQLQTNQFFSAAALSGVLMSSFYYLRSLPSIIWGFIVSRLTYTATIKENDSNYRLMRALEHYINANYAKRIRRAQYKLSAGIDESEVPELVTINDTNTFLIIYKYRRRILIRKGAKDLPNASRAETSETPFYTISAIRGKRAINALLAEILLWYETEQKKRQKENKNISVFVADKYQNGGWERIRSGEMLKTFSQTYLKEKNKIIEDLDKFIASKETYERLAIPYKRGYLFYGPPGTGKSTLATAIAKHLKFDLYYFDLSAISTSNQFTSMYNAIPANSVVLFEDIDILYNKRSKNKDSEGMNFTTLLNALSGVIQKSNIITVITTNKLGELDEALVRSGRCDFRMEIGHATKEVVEEYLKDVFEEPIVLDKFTPRPFVDVQEITQKHIHDKQTCILLLNN